MRRSIDSCRFLTFFLFSVLMVALVPARLALADEDQNSSTVQVVFDSSTGGVTAGSAREAFRNPKVSRVIALDKSLVDVDPSEASSLLFTIRNVHENGLLIGTDQRSFAEGRPGMAVGFSQLKGLGNSYACDVPVSVDLVSAAVGFDVAAMEAPGVVAEAWVPRQ